MNTFWATAPEDAPSISWKGEICQPIIRWFPKFVTVPQDCRIYNCFPIMPVPCTPISATGGTGKGVGAAAQDRKEVHHVGKCGGRVGV